MGKTDTSRLEKGLKVESDVESPLASTTVASLKEEGSKTKPHNKSRSWGSFFKRTSQRRIPPPAPPLEAATVTPLANASFLSILTYTWLSPLLSLGHKRPLEEGDLWKMDQERESRTLLAQLTRSIAEEKSRVLNGKNGWLLWQDRGEMREQTSRHDYSMLRALNGAFGRRYWAAGAYRVLSDTAMVGTPLLVRSVINHAKTFNKDEASVDDYLRGIGMALGLFILSILASVFQHQYYYLSISTGISIRSSLLALLHSQALSSTSQTAPPAIINHLSTDIPRLEYLAQWFHPLWCAPVQIILAIILMVGQMKVPPAAVFSGFGVFIALIPILQRTTKWQFKQRKESVKYTSMRADILGECLGSGGMRCVKYLGSEEAWIERIRDIRAKEMTWVRRMLVCKSANLALAFTVPILAAIVTVVVYAAVTRDLDPAVVFPVIALWAILRAPLLLLPRALSATVDGKNALDRLSKTLKSSAPQNLAQAFDDSAINTNNLHPDTEDNLAFEIINGQFAWSQEPTAFALRDINMKVLKGHLYAIIGKIGSGKSTLLSAILGEVAPETPCIRHGVSTIAYCSQVAWIQNATIRENIVFGQAWDEAKYNRVLDVACLRPDMANMVDGDMTEIGERGINLSGGQKQRINIARGLYLEADLYLLDDPLSAVDAHVGKDLFNQAIMGLKRSGKTVILVTHALHLLSFTDYIYSLNDGRVEHEGTYQHLKDLGVVVEAVQAPKEDQGDELTEVVEATDPKKLHTTVKQIKEETRLVGKISRRVYWHFFEASHGRVTFPVVLFVAILAQASQLLSTYTLVWWQRNTLNWPIKSYMLLHGMLGVSQTLFTFCMGSALGYQAYLASRNLHDGAVDKLFHANLSFYDRTPLGRILGVLGKDIDSMDNNLPDVIRMFFLTMSFLFGCIIIISIVFPYFLVAVVVLLGGYLYFAAYYQSSARELKRLDSRLRSRLFSQFSESLYGISTIRAYKSTQRFKDKNLYFIDLHNRASWVVLACERWLAIRLDLLGAFLVLIVAILCVVRVDGIGTAQVGLVMLYMIQLTQLSALSTRQAAEVDNNMNAVERVYQYTQDDVVPQEASHTQNIATIPNNWPAPGFMLSFQNVSMSYRDDLPNVLSRVTTDIGDGEKVAIVGRTGAGKSSLITALFRLRELNGGRIGFDGIDIAKLSLKTLRSRIAIIPQEPVLFQGTVRSNLDPFNSHQDVELNDVLRRAHLLGHEANKIALDTAIQAEGVNLSVGERALISLARAMIKDAKIIVLDEATASVDPETDRKIQETIMSSFAEKTVICIAHRLRTIINYDRIIVLDGGKIVETGTPIDLFLSPKNGVGLFRQMCNESGITWDQFTK